MPCYNAADYLKEALESIIEQTYKFLEIIVINDGSTDNTPTILKDYKSMDSRLKIVNHTVKQGIVSSLNLGIANATGEYIARMDADDVSDLSRIQIQVEYLLNHPEIDLVSCGFNYISTKGKHSIGILPRGSLPQALKFISFFATPLAHPSVVGKAACFRLNKYDDNFIHSEDYDLFSRMAFSGLKLFNLLIPLYSIRIHHARVSNLFEEKQIQSHINISRRNIEYYFHLQVNQVVHAIAVNRFLAKESKSDIVNAFMLIENIKLKYMNLEICSSQEKFEINKFISEQQTDILIQAMKNNSWIGRLSLAGISLKFIWSSPKSILFNYLMLKIRVRL